MKRIPLIVTLVVTLLLPASVVRSQVTGAATEQLGKVNFQTSCTPAASRIARAAPPASLDACYRDPRDE